MSALRLAFGSPGQAVRLPPGQRIDAAAVAAGDGRKPLVDVNAEHVELQHLGVAGLASIALETDYAALAPGVMNRYRDAHHEAEAPEQGFRCLAFAGGARRRALGERHRDRPGRCAQPPDHGARPQQAQPVVAGEHVRRPVVDDGAVRDRRVRRFGQAHDHEGGEGEHVAHPLEKAEDVELRLQRVDLVEEAPRLAHALLTVCRHGHSNSRSDHSPSSVFFRMARRTGIATADRNTLKFLG